LRHHYDLYKLAGSPIKDAALADRALLQAVVEFKERIYYSSWAHYDPERNQSHCVLPKVVQRSRSLMVAST
jgi:hypothetical protein